MTRKRSRLITIITIALICFMAAGIAYAAYGTNGYGFTTTPVYTNPSTRPDGVVNPDDNTNYISSSHSNGKTDIKFELIDGNQETYIGKIRVIGEYMYVYGYYYANATTTPSSTSLAGWRLQSSDLGWGCVVLDRTKSTYADPAGVIENQPVTWMNCAYSGCTNLTTSMGEDPWALPKIPASVKHTVHMFRNCTSLTKASCTTASTLSQMTFYGCRNLKDIFIGQNVTSLHNGTFSSMGHSDLILNFDAPSTSYTSPVCKEIRTDADYLIWGLE